MSLSDKQAPSSEQYEADKKKFYNDGSLKPDESLMFLIRFIPFAEVRGTGNTILKD